MPLIEELESNGRWLFRWRSYLPVAMLVLMFASFGYFSYPFGSETLTTCGYLITRFLHKKTGLLRVEGR